MRGVVAGFAALSLAMVAVPELAAAQDAAARTEDVNAPSDSHVAAAMDLLKSNHFTDNIQAMLDAILPIENQTIRRASPNLSDATIAMIEQKLREGIVERQDELMQLEAVEYCRHFNEQELHDLAAFYRSPVGQKYIATIPTLLKETTPIMQEWMKGVSAKVQQEILQSLSQKPNDKS